MISRNRQESTQPLPKQATDAASPTRVPGTSDTLVVYTAGCSTHGKHLDHGREPRGKQVCFSTQATIPAIRRLDVFARWSGMDGAS